MGKCYIFLAEGFEEVEALTVVDVLRRGGVDISMLSISGTLPVRGAHGIRVDADEVLADTDLGSPQWLILPGGMPGASNLAASQPVCQALQKQALRRGGIAAICASPAVVLGPLGLLDGKDATCYPGFEGQMPKAKACPGPVITAGNIITANGPAAALPFALAILAAVRGADIAQEVGSGMLLYPKKAPYYF